MDQEQTTNLINDGNIPKTQEQPAININPPPTESRRTSKSSSSSDSDKGKKDEGKNATDQYLNANLLKTPDVSPTKHMPKPFTTADLKKPGDLRSQSNSPSHNDPSNPTNTANLAGISLHSQKFKQTKPPASPHQVQYGQPQLSFDLIWFDLVTKTRHLIQEVCEPMVERVQQHKEQIAFLNRLIGQQDKRVCELEDIVIKRGEGVTVFDQIFESLTKEELERKSETRELKDAIKNIDKQIEGLEFRFINQDRQLQHIVENHEKDQLEYREIKNTIQKQNDEFIDKITLTNHQLSTMIDELREKISSLDFSVNHKASRLGSLENTVQETADRVREHHKLLDQLNQDVIRMQTDKLDFTKFDVEIKDVQHAIRLHYQQILDNQNHVLTLDNYLEKYQALRMQGMITETLMSVLGSREKQRLEQYDAEKNQILYKCVLEDQGTSNVQRMITQLNEKARKDVEEEEKRQKRKQAANGMSPLSNAGSESDISMKNQGKSPSLRRTKTRQVTKFGGGQSSPGLEEDETPKLGLQQIKNMDWQSPVFPDGVEPDDINHDLTDLAKAEFEIAEDDEDFNLSQEQLIKVMKIMLYRINVQSKKLKHEKEDLQKLIEIKKAESEKYTKCAMDEVSTFLSNVHSDFENFLKKHKKDHQDLQSKIQEVSQGSADNVDAVSTLKIAVDGYSTILACLVEYCNIDQALLMQDEIDRQQISLMGQKQVIRGDPSALTQPSQLTTLQPTSTTSQTAKEQAFTFAPGQLSTKHIASKTTLRGSRTNNRLLNISIDDRDLSNQILALDQQCLSCSGQPSHILQTFKLACLSYTPSKIIYRNDTFQRFQLMQMRQVILDKCEEIINTMNWPFVVKNLKPMKVFKDLIQFCGVIPDQATSAREQFYRTAGAGFSSNNNSTALNITSYDSRNASSMQRTTLSKNKISFSHQRKASESNTSFVENNATRLLKIRQQMQAQHFQAINQTLTKKNINISNLGSMSIDQGENESNVCETQVQSTLPEINK